MLPIIIIIELIILGFLLALGAGSAGRFSHASAALEAMGGSSAATHVRTSGAWPARTAGAAAAFVGERMAGSSREHTGIGAHRTVFCCSGGSGVRGAGRFSADAAGIGGTHISGPTAVKPGLARYRSTFVDSEWMGNQAGYGAAIYVYFENDVQVNRCLFRDNVATKGG